MNTLRRAAYTLLLLSAISGVAACSDKRPWMMEDSTLTPKPMTLVESRYIVKKPLADFGQADVDAAAHAYGRYGAGPMYVVVAHSDTAKGSMSDRTSAIASKFMQAGIAPNDIITSTVPLTTEAPVALVAFDTLEAGRPQGCDDDIPGLKTLPGQKSDFDYTLGCTVKGYMAKQIAKPSDLRGVAGLGGDNNGEHLANVVNATKGPEPRAFLPSYVISTLANSGQ